MLVGREMGPLTCGEGCVGGMSWVHFDEVEKQRGRRRASSEGIDVVGVARLNSCWGSGQDGADMRGMDEDGE